jgi:hypothetical protein
MRSEQTAVRTRIRTAEVQFRRLHQGLEQAFTILQSQPPAAAESPAPLPAEFLAPFQAASIGDRPAIVQEYFEIDAVLKVRVGRGANSGYEIRFAPVPLPGCLVFFTQTAQLARLEQLGDAVLIQDPETGQQRELKLVQFVKQVQSGAWLLKRR